LSADLVAREIRVFISHRSIASDFNKRKYINKQDTRESRPGKQRAIRNERMSAFLDAFRIVSKRTSNYELRFLGHSRNAETIGINYRIAFELDRRAFKL